MVSRESSFMFNNLILLATGFAVLWGTLFPIISEALQGEKRSVGPLFFNKINIPVGLFLLFLTGVGPLLAWRKTSFRSLQKNFTLPVVLSLVMGLIFFTFGMRHFYSTVCLMLCVFVVCTIISEFHRGANARRKQGEGYLESLWILTFRNTRRYGGYIVHLGMVCLFVGLAGAGFNKEAQKEMVPGDSLSLGKYTLTLEQIKSANNANYQSATALMTVYKDGTLVDTLLPERRYYKANDTATTEVALRSGLNEDLYLVFSGIEKDNSKLVFHAYLNPLVSWVWIGGIIFVLGTVICLIPSKQGMARSKVSEKVEVEELAKA